MSEECKNGCPERQVCDDCQGATGADWKAITDPEELFKLKREGWEIEFRAHKTYTWRTWMGGAWQDDWLFQARPRQPKKVKMLCWLDGTWLQYATEEHSKIIQETTKWIRIPTEDKEIEVPDDN